MAKKKTEEITKEACFGQVLAIKDALEVLHGRWRLPILLSLSYGPKRFTQISRELNGITDKVLSKDLKELELNKLINRTVIDAFPPMVEYTITEHGMSLKNVIEELSNWGFEHRKKIIEGFKK